MNSSLNSLEKIMKPYFDKKNEIDTKSIDIENEISNKKSEISELKRDRIENRRALEVELENLRVRHILELKEFEERKETEIEEFINQALNSNPNLSVVYGSTVRKDLEPFYAKKLEALKEEFNKKEANLLEEISKLKKVSEEQREEESNLKEINKPYNFRNVDLREMVELKDDLRKQLFALRKRLNNDLSLYKEEIEHRNNLSIEILKLQDQLIENNNKLSNFKYEYNEQNQLINGQEWRSLYEESRKISEKIDEIRMLLSEKSEAENIKFTLNKLEEYISMTELSKEEIKAVMSSMTPLEKNEYNRRKSINNFKLDEKDIIEIDDPIEYEVLKSTDEVIANDKANLFQFIFNDIITETKKLSSIKINSGKENIKENQRYISSKNGAQHYELDGIIDLKNTTQELPCGEYFNVDDTNQAIDDLYNKNKGRTFTVKEVLFNKKYQITQDSVAKIKQVLKKCSRIKLLKENKISKSNLLKVFSKENFFKVERKTELGSINNSNAIEGDYISRDDLIVALDNLFATKKIEWLKKASKKISDFMKRNKKEEVELIELDDEYKFVK